MMEAVLGPCMEVDPSRFVVVMGPSFTAAVLQQAMCKTRSPPSRNDPKQKLPAVNVKGMVNEGLSILMESRQFQSEPERAESEQLYRNALEVEPLMKLSTSMQQCGRYSEWLERCFSLGAVQARAPSILTHLAELQDSGALLVYTGCDDALCKLSGLQVLVADREETVIQWRKGQLKGIMHVHGVYWKPESVQLNCDVYKTLNHPARTALEQLGSVFRERFVFSLGVCDTGQLDNPMMAVFTRTFLTAASHNHSFSLAMETTTPNAAAGLRSGLLQLPCLKRSEVCPDFSILPLRDSSRMLCAELNFPSEHLPDHQMLALLVSSKSHASEIAKMMFNSPGVNFALMNSVSVPGHVACTVSVRVESAKLADLWAWLWEEKRSLLIGHGLLAVVMQTGTVIWVQGYPKGIPLTTNDQVKQEVVVPMETVPHPIIRPNPKLLSPLVRQDFPIPKPGTKKVPRYTVTKLPIRPTPGTSFTLPPSNGLSKVHMLGFSDDTAMYAQDFHKNVNWARRCSLPPPVPSGSSSDSMLYQLAENCKSVSSDLHPPSYTAIKQALLCDKYKRRQSMQTDPKTLKNLLQTKLVISDRSDDLINLRRKSDPGSYMKQRDFDRRKELFMDENMSWSKSYGRVIDQQIHRWQKKRQAKMQRDQMLSWQKTDALNPIKLGMLNPLMAAQSGMINPLQVGGIASPGSALFPGAFLNTASPGGVVNPYILPHGVLAGSGATANAPIYYNPFGTRYALVSPYTSLQLATAQTTPQTAAYLVPQTNLTNAQPSLYYYMPAPPTTATPPSTATTSAATPLSLGITAPVSMTTLTMSGDHHQHSSLNTTPNSTPPILSPNGGTYPQHTSQAPSPQTQRPISPNSRKRHQSVPEKLTSLLQPPPLVCSNAGGSGRVSPMEVNLDSPPSSKKQRSTSDTTLYHTPYMFGQYSPGGSSSGASHSPHRLSVSPQPPLAPPTEGLTTLQTHLLQVHQSAYGMTRTAQEERVRRRNRSPREKRGNSPRRKLSGGVVKSESMSPISVQSNDGEEAEQWELQNMISSLESRTEEEGEEEGRERETNNHNIKMEYEAETDNDSSRSILWHFLLDLLVSSSDMDLLQWTDNEFEFQILKPAEVSKLWGKLTNNSAMSHDKLLSGIQSYFKQGILTQVQGRKLTFKFAGHIRNYVQMRRSQVNSAHEEVVVV